MVDQVLSIMLFEKRTLHYNRDLNEITEQFEVLYNELLSCKISISDFDSNLLVNSVDEQMREVRRIIKQESRTASLWLEYQNIIGIIRKLITADRIGDWNLHLEAIQQSLPIFAAAGHYSYSKSACLYLQSMLNLEISNQPVYEKFKGGNFIVRRSARYWAGLPCDLVIEQVLMRSLKSTGVLTRGSGISEITRAIWLLSNPICSKYSLVMEENIGVLFTTSEQHQTATKARISRDKQDTNKIYERVVDISPFKNDPTLHNIINCCRIC